MSDRDERNIGEQPTTGGKRGGAKECGSKEKRSRVQPQARKDEDFRTFEDVIALMTNGHEGQEDDSSVFAFKYAGTITHVYVINPREKGDTGTGMMSEYITLTGLANVMYTRQARETSGLGVYCMNKLLADAMKDEVFVTTVSQACPRDWGRIGDTEIMIAVKAVKAISSSLLLFYAQASRNNVILQQACETWKGIFDIITRPSGINTVLRKPQSFYSKRWIELKGMSDEIKEFEEAIPGSVEQLQGIEKMRRIAEELPHLSSKFSAILNMKGKAEDALKMAAEGQTELAILSALAVSNVSELFEKMPLMMERYNAIRRKRASQLETENRIQVITMQGREMADHQKRLFPPSLLNLVNSVILGCKKASNRMIYDALPDDKKVEGQHVSAEEFVDSEAHWNEVYNLFFKTKKIEDFSENIRAELQRDLKILRDTVIGKQIRYVMDGILEVKEGGHTTLHGPEKLLSSKDLFHLLVLASIDSKYFRDTKRYPPNVADDETWKVDLSKVEISFLSQVFPEIDAQPEMVEDQIWEAFEGVQSAIARCYRAWGFYFGRLDITQKEVMDGIIKAGIRAAETSKLFSLARESFVHDVLFLFLRHCQHKDAKDPTTFFKIVGNTNPSFIDILKEGEAADDWHTRKRLVKDVPEVVLEILDDDKLDKEKKDQFGNILCFKENVRAPPPQPPSVHPAQGGSARKEPEEQAGDNAADTDLLHYSIKDAATDKVTAHIMASFKKNEKEHYEMIHDRHSAMKKRIHGLLHDLFDKAPTENFCGLTAQEITCLTPLGVDTFLMKFEPEFDDRFFVGPETFFEGEIGKLVEESRNHGVSKAVFPYAVMRTLTLHGYGKKSKGYTAYKDRTMQDLNDFFVDQNNARTHRHEARKRKGEEPDTPDEYEGEEEEEEEEEEEDEDEDEEEN